MPHSSTWQLINGVRDGVARHFAKIDYIFLLCAGLFTLGYCKYIEVTLKNNCLAFLYKQKIHLMISDMNFRNSTVSLQILLQEIGIAIHSLPTSSIILKNVYRSNTLTNFSS